MDKNGVFGGYSPSEMRPWAGFLATWECPSGNGVGGGAQLTGGFRWFSGCEYNVRLSGFENKMFVNFSSIKKFNFRKFLCALKYRNFWPLCCRQQQAEVTTLSCFANTTSQRVARRAHNQSIHISQEDSLISFHWKFSACALPKNLAKKDRDWISKLMIFWFLAVLLDHKANALYYLMKCQHLDIPYFFQILVMHFSR